MMICRICLETAQRPQITTCGHVFCTQHISQVAVNCRFCELISPPVVEGNVVCLVSNKSQTESTCPTCRTPITNKSNGLISVFGDEPPVTLYNCDWSTRMNNWSLEKMLLYKITKWSKSIHWWKVYRRF